MEHRDAGFTLIEVVVAIVLLLLVSLPAGRFFMQAQAQTQLEQQRQTASVLADRALETARGLGLGDLAALEAGTGTPDPSLDADPVPVNGTKYAVSTSVETCFLDAAPGSTCIPGAAGSGGKFYRVTVSASWQNGRVTQQCSSGLTDGRCQVLATTLVSTSTVDATFLETT